MLVTTDHFIKVETTSIAAKISTTTENILVRLDKTSVAVIIIMTVAEDFLCIKILDITNHIVFTVEDGGKQWR